MPRKPPSPQTRLLSKPLGRPPIVNELTLHAAYLERYGQHEVATLLRLFDSSMIPDIESAIVRRLGTGKPPGVRTMQMQNALADMRRIVADTIGGAGQDFRVQMQSVAKNEAEYAAAVVRRFDASTANNTQLPPASVLRSLVAEPVFDRKLSDWFGDISTDTSRRVERAVVRGVILGNTVPEIVRSVVGDETTPGGVFAGSRSAATTLVRTAVTQIANRARAEAFETLGLDEYEWVSTLDSRTSQTCVALDGQRWKVGKGPLPPAHPNCRSTTVPVIPGMTDGPQPRTSMDGVVQVKDFGSWLQSKPPNFADQLLGPGKAEIWRRGNVPLDRFVNKRTLEPLTYRQLQDLDRRMAQD